MKYAAWLSVILPGFLLLTINSSGEDSLPKKFRPALIGKHDTSLIRLIEFPKSKKDLQIVIKCEGQIGNPANPRMYTVELQYNL